MERAEASGPPDHKGRLQTEIGSDLLTLDRRIEAIEVHAAKGYQDPCRGDSCRPDDICGLFGDTRDQVRSTKLRKLRVPFQEATPPSSGDAPPAVPPCF